jgi:hypothetical protein
MLPQNFEKLVSLIQDPAEREATRKDLEGGFLRQEDYSRKMNELTEAEKVRAAAYGEGKKWVDENRNNYKTAIQQREEALLRAKELETRLSTMEHKTPPAEPDINVADDAILARELKQARADATAARAEASRLSEAVTRIDKMLTDGQLITADRLNEEANKKFEAYGEAILGTVETLQRSNGEYGKSIDRKALLSEAAKFGGDLNKAYDSLTAEFRLDKMKKDIRAEVEKEFQAKLQVSGAPLAGGGSPMEMGPLQQRVFAAKNPESTIDASIPADGSLRLAHAIGAELRAEGKV